MRETEPEIFLIARPSVDVAAMGAYLDAVGGRSWLDRREGEGAPDAELLVEFSGGSATGRGSPG